MTSNQNAGSDRQELPIRIGNWIDATPYIAVVGGANIDIGGRSHAPLIMGDSNPGSLVESVGGVGRNIAHNIRLLGTTVRFFTALGSDDNGMRIRAGCFRAGIDFKASFTFTDVDTSRYLHIDTPEGELALALNDMDIYDRLTPEHFAKVMDLLNAAALVVLDTNIPAACLEYIAENCTVPMFADPVSAVKAPRLKGILGKLDTLKANRLEAEALTGIAITDDASLDRAADALLAAGVRRVFITLGPDGVLAADGAERLRLQNPPQNITNVTGSGDAFSAALAWAALQNMDLRASARCGLAAAALAMESDEAVNQKVTAEMLQAKLESF